MVSKALSIRQVPSGMLLIEDRIGWFVRPRRSVVVDFCASVDGCVRRKALAAVWLLFSGVRLDQPKADSAICCRPQAEKRKVAQMTGKRVQDCASGSAPKGLNSDMFCIKRMLKVYQRAERPPTPANTRQHRAAEIASLFSDAVPSAFNTDFRITRLLCAAPDTASTSRLCFSTTREVIPSAFLPRPISCSRILIAVIFPESTVTAVFAETRLVLQLPFQVPFRTSERSGEVIFRLSISCVSAQPDPIKHDKRHPSRIATLHMTLTGSGDWIMFFMQHITDRG